MLLQISSGQGPAECEYAVGLLFQALKKEYPDIELLYEYPSREKNCYRSILFTTKEDLSHPSKTESNPFADGEFFQGKPEECGMARTYSSAERKPRESLPWGEGLTSGP